jgi:hypothetical protein
MNDNFLSTKFIMSLIGIGLCVIWAAFKLEKEYLIIALGFVTAYITGNVIQKFSNSNP